MMMLYWLQQTRQQADHVNGRWHHQVGDPSGKDETRANPYRRGDERQQEIDPEVCSKRFMRYGTGESDAPNAR